VHCSELHKKGERSKHQTDCNERSNAGNEIRNADEKQPGDEWNDRALPATIDAIPSSQRAEEQAEEEKRGAHGCRCVA
jgi:hypothetical protein